MTHPRSGRSALVLGATGLVGGHCVDLLLRDPDYTTVHVIVRRPTGRASAGLEEHVLDYDLLSAHPDLFRVDSVLCCLGTTIRKAGSRQAFRRIDLEYPAEAARLAARAGAKNFVIVTSLGADPRSRIFYNRAKGEVEEAVRRAGLPVWALRPSLLLGERREVRPAERLAQVLLRPIIPVMVGPLRRLRPVDAATVAQAMVNLARREGPGGVVESERIPVVARA